MRGNNMMTLDTDNLGIDTILVSEDDSINLTDRLKINYILRLINELDDINYAFKKIKQLVFV